jgi:hypothetical protein
MNTYWIITYNNRETENLDPKEPSFKTSSTPTYSVEEMEKEVARIEAEGFHVLVVQKDPNPIDKGDHWKVIYDGRPEEVVVFTEKDSLMQMLSTMKLPEKHKSNMEWLANNLAKSNSDHPAFDEAMKLIRKLNKRN